MKHRTMKGATLALGLIAATTVACEDNGAVGVNDNATIRVLLTDAPADYIAAAWVDIGAIQLVPPEAEGQGIITLTDDGTDGMIDLLELQNAATEQLAVLDIEPGRYAQMRLIVDSARVDLKEGYAFRDGTTSKTLFVPSGAQTGIKLNLGAGDTDGDGEPGIAIVPGENVLVLDFDVNQSFRLQGNPESPAGIHGVIFKPTLRVVVHDVAGSISGAVSTELEGFDLENLVVTAEPADEGTVEFYQTTTATAVTGEDGSYTIHFLVPGSYAVTVTVGEGFTTAPASIDVTVSEDEDVDGVDFVVETAD